MSDRLIELRIENQKLKQEVQNLEAKVLSLVGMITVESSGGPEKRNIINDHLMGVFYSTETQLKIVSPKIDQFYANELKKLAEKGVAILIITNDRGNIPPHLQPVYDDLKLISGINIINNPNVRYLLVYNSKEALYSGGSLDKQELDKSILIVTIIKEIAKLRKIEEIFSIMLPSFMRS